jgi:hypothetical protein
MCPTTDAKLLQSMAVLKSCPLSTISMLDAFARQASELRDRMERERIAALARTCKDWRESCKAILRMTLESFSSDAERACFWFAVDGKQVPDYYKVVKRPACLSMVNDKLVCGGYSTELEFRDDMRLVWANCETYYTRGKYPSAGVFDAGMLARQTFERAWAWLQGGMLEISATVADCIVANQEDERVMREIWDLLPTNCKTSSGDTGEVDLARLTNDEIYQFYECLRARGFIAA